ncbi:MAG TPA: choice-of-anchor D domain-containing protein, partial [Candidatus Entotheonella sp.]
TPEIQLSPSSLVFGDVEVGSERLLPVTLTNTGVAELTVHDLQVDNVAGEPFVLDDTPTLPVMIAPRSSVEVDVAYRPLAAGATLSTLRVSSDASNIPEASVALIGNAVPQPVPQVEVDPLSLSLGEVELGAERTRSLRIRNTGTADLSITSLEITSASGGAFALNNPPTLPVSMTPGAEVTVGVQYRPLIVGSVTGALRVHSNAEATPAVTVALSGTGVTQPVPEIEVSRSSISFGAVQVQAPGASAVTVTQSVQIRNTGNANLTLTALGIESSVGTEFTLGSMPALPVALAPQAAVNVEVQYRPETIGTVTGALHIRSNADNISDVTVALNGTGVSMPLPQIIASIPALAFGEMQVGSSRMLEVNLTNTGTAALTLLTATVSGHAAFTLQQAPTFPVMLAPNDSVALRMQYQPSAEGSVTGVLKIESDAANTPDLIVALSGTGTSVPMALIEVNPLDIAFAEVEVGMSRIVPVTIANSGTADLRVTDLVLTTSTGTDFSLASAPPVPMTVQPNTAITLDVRYEPMAVGTATGTLRIESNSLETPAVIVPLSGTGVAVPVPQLVVSPLSVSFGEVELGTSRDIAVTIANAGNADLTVTGLQIDSEEPGVFRLGTVPMPPVLVTPGASTPVQVIFEPTVAGAVTGTLQILSDVDVTPEVTVSLSGTGVAVPVPQIVAEPAAVAFGDVEVNDTQVLTVTLRNPGTSDLEISELVLEAAADSGLGLRAAPTTPVLVVPGGAVTVDVAYTPPAQGPVAGTLRVQSNAVNASELLIPVRGTGAPLPMPQLVMTPVALDFDAVEMGQSSALTLSISNPGTGDLEISSVTLDTLAASGFALTGGPLEPATVAMGETLEIEVTFTPTAEGTVTGTVQLLSNAVNTPEVVVPLQGIGVSVPVPQISVQPVALSFGEVPVGSSVSLPLMVQNIGSAPLNIAALTLEAAASSGFASTNTPGGAGVVVLPGELFNMEVSYTPTAAGTVTGTVRIQSDAVNVAEVIVPLQGTGTVALPEPQIAVTPASVAFGALELGQTRTMTVQVRNIGTGALDLTGMVLEAIPDLGFTLSGIPALPASLEPGASFSIDVVYAPISAGPANSQLRIASNAANAAAITIPISGTGTPIPGPGILVLPAALDLGAVVLGQSLTLSVEVRSAGTEVLNLTEVVLEVPPGLGLTLSGVPALPTSLQPGALFSMDVSYAPTAVGPVDSQLRIASNAVNGAQVLVPVSGIGRMPEAQIEVLPTALDFGEVELGQDLTLSVEIRNVGDADLELISVTLPAGIDTEFILGDIPERVAPGGIAVIEVTYQPTALGPVVGGSLQLQSNAVNTPNVSVSLSGTGVPDSEAN